MTGHTFVETFALNALRRRYPSCEVQVLRSPMDNYSRVSFTVSDKELVLYDREETLRKLARRLLPSTEPRKHWSLFRRTR